MLALPVQGQTPTSPSADVAAELAASRARLAAESYVTPAPDLVKLVTAPRQQNALLAQQSPDRRHFLREESGGMPSVTSFGKPHYYFGGLQVDPAANRARALTTRGAVALTVVDAGSGQTRALELPAGATASNPVWSPDGKQVAFVANFPETSRAYVADLATGKSRDVTPPGSALLATLVTSVDWTAGGNTIVAVLVPDKRGPPPVSPAIATGPRVRLWMDSLKSPQRNYASLLQEPFDQALLEYYVTGQLVAIDLRTRAARKLGSPAMISDVDPSPDGKYFRVTTMRKPFSYVVQYGSFGEVEEIWDASGKVLAEVVKRPLRESADTGDTPAPRREGSKRSLAWMPSGDGLYYLEAVGNRSGGTSDADSTGPAPTARGPGAASASNRPDRLVRWMPPFGPGDTTVLYRAEGPVSQVVLSEDAALAFFGVIRNGSGEIFAVRLSQPDQRYPIVRQRGYTPVIAGRTAFGPGAGGRGVGANDSLSFYSNPGALTTKPGPRGGVVALLSPDSAVFLSGIRYDRNFLENIPRQFVDKVSIGTGVKTRIYEGPADVSETLTAPLDDDFAAAVVVRESPTAVPNAYRRELKIGTLTRLTDNRDLTPEFTSLVRKRIVVTRADGIKFVVRVTLPAGYQAGTRLPGMLWLYPYEYTDQAGYDRSLRTENVKRFPASQPRTIEFLATQGYAVTNFDPPIIGEQGRMNDNYVSDLRMNLYAVIDQLDRQAIIDRTRLGIGGHSYGAFSTVNALVHTPFFKAGIAGDGMYNRTLTPTGFQSERRDLWSGQKTYLDMSPMLSADKLQGALLMYHNLEDQNVGTDPISSIRMMQALRAEGKVAALYMYPYEDHGPATRETILDLWGRWTAWLDIYVKNAGVALPKAAVAAGGNGEKQP
ncbi:MAG TPA: prolyl oligopeptidase family serine peptidase [Gemmatimonadales bacterium]|nr:prolyl oligopeptidase family serine peptidase [Gemmatimonadales bacterium]